MNHMDLVSHDKVTAWMMVLLLAVEINNAARR